MKNFFEKISKVESKPNIVLETHKCLYIEVIFHKRRPSLSDVFVLLILKVPACSEGVQLSVGTRTALPLKQTQQLHPARLPADKPKLGP